MSGGTDIGPPGLPSRARIDAAGRVDATEAMVPSLPFLETSSLGLVWPFLETPLFGLGFLGTT